MWGKELSLHTSALLQMPHSLVTDVSALTQQHKHNHLHTQVPFAYLGVDLHFHPLAHFLPALGPKIQPFDTFKA